MKHEKSCGCIIIEDKKVLLIKQTNGVWGFPKGHVEENETELQTAEREVKEETNIDVKTLSETLGHANVNITLNRYVHSSLDTKKKYVEKLNFVA